MQKKPGLSSLKLISAGKIKLAVRDLIIHGIVVHGNHLGRTFGFPTANILPSGNHEKNYPHGVYLVSVSLNARKLFGICNIGFRPTIGGTNLVIEVNILDFSEDIYGKEISVKILKPIRKEKKFQNLEKLVNQIRLDKEKAESILSALNKDQA